MRTSRIHRRKPMPKIIARANAKKPHVRTVVEHVIARQKNRFGLFTHPIGLLRAEAKLTLANLAYNFDRMIFHERHDAMGRLCLESPKCEADQTDPGDPFVNSEGSCGCTLGVTDTPASESM